MADTGLSAPILRPGCLLEGMARGRAWPVRDLSALGEAALSDGGRILQPLLELVLRLLASPASLGCNLSGGMHW